MDGQLPAGCASPLGSTRGFDSKASRGDTGASKQGALLAEAGRLLDEVRRALDSDIGRARRPAARLAALLDGGCSGTGRTTARGGLAPWQSRRVERHIEAGLEAGLAVHDLARLVSLSPSHFCRAFKESFGAPPHAYVLSRRIERAKALMLTTSERLSAIALACGLADQAHLCRAFRRIVGTSPAAWRRDHAQGPGDHRRRADGQRAPPAGGGGGCRGAVAGTPPRITSR
jgi:AraC-like DNA-binding protein